MIIIPNSKPLKHDDSSAFEFVKDMLKNDVTYAINFDRIQWDNKEEKYVIVEYLLCKEEQTVTPYTSHPNNYFYKNSMKFISLWELTRELEAKLYLVNYAKKGTEHENKVKVMLVENVDRESNNPVETKDHNTNRENFSKWFRSLNERGKR